MANNVKIHEGNTIISCEVPDEDNMEKSSGIMAKTKTLTLALKGEIITSKKLRDSISAFYDFVDEISEQVSGKKKHIEWIVTPEHGSIILHNIPVDNGEISSDIISTALCAIHDGINNLKSKTERPEYFSDKALEHLKKLVFISTTGNTGITEINVAINGNIHVLTTQIAANIDTIMGIRYKSLGSVEGKLQTISERGTPTFTIFDSLDDKPVRCHIPDDLRSEALDAFGQRIYIFGMISYDQYGTPKSIQVEELKLFSKQENIPTAEQICGILGE
ncbi:MAG: hypothetical protein H7843_15115 [Nitrospirota bacterium]